MLFILIYKIDFVNESKQNSNRKLKTTTASLNVKANVLDNTVYIDNINYGSTPLNLDLDFGIHTIRIEKIGCFPFEKLIELSLNSLNIDIYGELEPIPIRYSKKDNATSPLRAPYSLFYQNSQKLYTINEDDYSKMVGPWIIVAKSDKINIFKEPDKHIIIYETMAFDKFFVFNKHKHNIKVQKFDNKSIVGWTRVEKFIILPHCEKTVNHYHKAIVQNRVYCKKNPLSQSDFTKHKITPFNFSYIYSYYPNIENPQYFLIGNKPYFSFHVNNEADISFENSILGWVSATNILPWKSKSALYPNSHRKHPIYFFKTKKDLVAYYKKNINKDKYPECSTLLSCKSDDSNMLLVKEFDTEISLNKNQTKIMPIFIIEQTNYHTNYFAMQIAKVWLSDVLSYAYVTLKRPGKKYSMDPMQFTEIFLFTRADLEGVLLPFALFRDKYQCSMFPENAVNIVKELIVSFYQEKEHYEPKSFKMIYEETFGVPLQSSNILLRTKYQDLDRLKIDSINTNKLSAYLCNNCKKLKKIYHNDKNFFKISGISHIWISFSSLP